MDRTTEYRAIVRRVLKEIADWMPSTATLQTELVCDDTLGHYHIGEVGWEGKRRIDNMLIHVDVPVERVWLQYNGTDLLVADEFVRAGIPKEHIVLGFQHPDRRPDTEFATA